MERRERQVADEYHDTQMPNSPFEIRDVIEVPNMIQVYMFNTSDLRNL